MVLTDLWYIFSSIVPAVSSLYTVTSFFWPILQARSRAWNTKGLVTRHEPIKCDKSDRELMITLFQTEFGHLTNTSRSDISRA